MNKLTITFLGLAVLLIFLLIKRCGTQENDQNEATPNVAINAFAQKIENDTLLKRDSIVHGQPNEAEILAIATEVYDAVFGACQKQFAIKKPKFELSDSKKIISGYDKSTHTIVLEKYAVETLISVFGKDSREMKMALAVILGHELAHAVDGLPDYETCIKAYSDRKGNKAAEREADYRGCAFAYFAGYDPRKVMPKALAALYAVYPQPSKEYLPFPERVKVAEKIDSAMLQIIEAYELAGTFSDAGDYESASKLYKYILEEAFYDGKEIYLMAANSSFSFGVYHSIEKYAYILDEDGIDLVKGHFGESTQSPKSFYEEAQKNYEKALGKDSTYAAAWQGLINVLAANADAKTPQMFENIKNRLPKNSKLQSAAKNALAIYYAKTDSLNAVGLWQELLNTEKRETAKFNLERQKNTHFKLEKQTPVFDKNLLPKVPTMPESSPKKQVIMKNKNLVETWEEFDLPNQLTLYRFVSFQGAVKNIYKKTGTPPPAYLQQIAQNLSNCHKIYKNDGSFLIRFREQGLTFCMDKKGKIKYWYFFGE